MTDLALRLAASLDLPEPDSLLFAAVADARLQLAGIEKVMAFRAASNHRAANVLVRLDLMGVSERLAEAVAEYERVVP